MSRIIGSIVAWAAGRLALLLFVVALLLAGAWLRGEWERLQRARAELPALEQRLASLRDEQASIERRLAAAELAWAGRRQRLQRQLSGQLAAIDAAVERTEGPWREALAKYSHIEERARSARRAADAAAARRDRLEREVAWWPWPLDVGKRTELATERARFVALDQQARAWELARDRVAPAFRASPLQDLMDRRATAAAELSRLLEAPAPGTAEMERNRELRRRDAALLERQLAERRAEIARDPAQRLLDAIVAALPAAAWIVLAVTLMPLALKAIAYFAIAPLAARLGPVRVLQANPDAPSPTATASAVSITVDAAPGEELLLHPDFLQSSSEQTPKSTRWLLDPALPFTSLASGMYALTQIAGAGTTGSRVTVSALRDPLDEVAAVTIPRGAAMVVQPRALAGVLKSASAPLRITRHWRLLTLHAWLTLQLRYLVFHGPCTLVVHGCRGVRAEPSSPAQARVINQDATLGFSAGLDYRNARCETFVAFLRGRDSLFDDVFAGGPGIFLLEELPSGRRGGGPLGRGLAGMADAALKAFGI